MKFIFLGTSGGMPTRARNVTALALQLENQSNWWLFDCGEGTQYQVLNTPLTLANLSHIFITHLHGDHLFGLPGLLSTRSMEGTKNPIQIYGPPGLRSYVDFIANLSQIQLAYTYCVHEFPTEGCAFSVGNFSLRAVKLSHNILSFAYLVQESELPGKFNTVYAQQQGVPEGPLFGKLKKGENIKLENGRTIKAKDFLGPNRPGRKFIVGGDNDNPELLIPYLKDAHLLIHEATMTEEVKKAIPIKIYHSTAHLVAKTAQIIQLPQLILTHFSTRFSKDPKTGKHHVNEIYEEARNSYQGKIFLAEDFKVFTLDREGHLHEQAHDERNT